MLRPYRLIRLALGGEAMGFEMPSFLIPQKRDGKILGVLDVAFEESQGVLGVLAVEITLGYFWLLFWRTVNDRPRFDLGLGSSTAAMFDGL